MAEQQVSEFGLDVFTLQTPGPGCEIESSDKFSSTGLLVAAPRVAMTVHGAQDFYTQR